MKKLVFYLMTGLLFTALTGCLKSRSEGACSGYSPVLDRTYCYDDWNEKECREWDDLEVNGADWTYTPDVSCFDIGLEPSYP